MEHSLNTDINSVVVAGAGQAGCQLIDSLRQTGYRGEIHLVGEEPHLPYQRPPLSKKFLSGEIPAQRLALRPEALYEKHRIHTHIGVQATQVDPAKHTLTLDNGKVLTYDRLALCTGAHVARLPVPGTDLAGVHYLRTINDVMQIKAELDRARHIVIVGAGFIGLETAAVLSAMGKCRGGCKVTVVEMQDRVMARAVAPVISDFFQALHARHGVEIRLGYSVTELMGSGNRLSAVRLNDGECIATDLCIIGIGIQPNVSLAARAGLRCENGICVDEYAVTSHDSIVAAGDCTNHPNPLLGQRLRLESVHNAIEQAKTAAASILGERKSYRQYPWFWSDQYAVKLQMVGISHGYDTVVTRGDMERQQCSFFYFAAGHLIAVDSINRPAEHMQARRLLNEGIPITPSQAANPECDLKFLS
jgi:3-phenylpropionate/trans-cinnamate dioxygenase ferredoxin reductase component